MTVCEAILKRKSVREYKDISIERPIIEGILHVASHAPSAKNRQPWYFYIIDSMEKRNELAYHMKLGIDSLIDKNTSLGINRPDLFQAYETINTIKQAPITIFVCYNDINRSSYDDGVDWNISCSDLEAVDIQSIGAIIQNILLLATNEGLASLWSCDFLYSYSEISAWLQTDRPILAAVSLGYPNEEPTHKVRRPVQEIVCWIK